MAVQTRWNHLSDKELLDYRGLLPRTTVGVNVEPSMAEELFNRLELKEENDEVDAVALREDLANAEAETKEIESSRDALQMENIEQAAIILEWEKRHPDEVNAGEERGK